MGIARKRKVIVTGAHGFLGRNVSRRLAQLGCEVIGIGHGDFSQCDWHSWGLAVWHQADVTLDALATYGGEAEAVFHCAGGASVGYSLSNPLEDFHRTVGTTLAVLEYLRTVRPAAVLVFPSSAGVYGIAKDLPVQTRDALNPVSPYGLHKKISEELCRSYGRSFAIRTVIVRLFSMYGIGLRKQLLWDACRKLAKGANPIFEGTGRETRDWIHIDDVVELLIEAERLADDTVPVLNGGSGVATSVESVIKEIAHELGIGRTSVRFSGKIRAGDPPHYQAGIASEYPLNWSPQRNLWIEIRKYVNWFSEGSP